MRIKIPVVELEFEEGGNTIWVHGPDGTTVLRVRADKILERTMMTNVHSSLPVVVSRIECSSPNSHDDEALCT